jgi:hypothetical protein
MGDSMSVKSDNQRSRPLPPIEEFLPLVAEMQPTNINKQKQPLSRGSILALVLFAALAIYLFIRLFDGTYY